MRRKNIPAALLLVIMLTAACRNEKDVIITGTVAVKGNMPFARTVFVAEDGTTFIIGPSEKETMGALQGKKIRVKARAYRIDMETADGKHMFVEWHLKDIKILDQ